MTANEAEAATSPESEPKRAKSFRFRTRLLFVAVLVPLLPLLRWGPDAVPQVIMAVCAVGVAALLLSELTPSARRRRAEASASPPQSA